MNTIDFFRKNINIWVISISFVLLAFARITIASDFDNKAFYGQISIGTSQLTDNHHTRAAQSLAQPELDVVTTRDGNTPIFHLALGYYYPNNLRTEIEFFQAEYELKDNLKIIQGGILPTLMNPRLPLGSSDGTNIPIQDGEFSIKGILLSANYDLTNWHFSGWTPYIGAGIGHAEIKLSVKNLVNGRDEKFIYSWRIGTNYQLANSVFSVEYRYLAANKPSYTGSTSGLTFNSEFKTHSINLGIRFDF